MGESLRAEFGTAPIDTGRRMPSISPLMTSLGTPDISTPPFMPGTGLPNAGGQPTIMPGQPGAPITRMSFLSAFLSNLGPALAGGLLANGDPRFPFGTGLPGALASIQEQQRYNAQLQNANADRARTNALAQSTIANQQSEENFRNAQIAALQYKGEEKPLGSEFTDANGNRVQWLTGPNGVRQQILGKAAVPVPTAESVKVDFNGLVQKALTGMPPTFDAKTLQDPKALYTMVSTSTALTPQEKNKALSYMVTNPEKSAMSGNLFYAAAQGDQAAQKALGLETAQKVAVAKAGQAGLPAGLAGVAPHLVAPAAADAQKAGADYVAANNAAEDMNTFISLAKKGNKIAYSYSPTEGVLSFNTARGVKRVNMAEISSYSGAGSAADRVSAFFGKQASGASIPDDILNDMASIHEAIRGNAQKAYGDRLKVINETYGSSFKPTDLSGGSSPDEDAAVNALVKKYQKAKQ